VQQTGVGQHKGTGAHADVDLVGVIAEHDGVVLFDVARALFVGGHQLIVQQDTLAVGAGDDLETAVLDAGVAEIVGDENLLRPGRDADRVLPACPVLVPVERRFARVLGQDDDAAGALEVAEPHLFERLPRGLPFQEPPDDVVLLTVYIDVLALVPDVGWGHVFGDETLGLFTQLLQKLLGEDVVNEAVAVLQHLFPFCQGDFGLHGFLQTCSNRRRL